MQVKHELMQVFPPVDDWIVVKIRPGSRNFVWEIVYAMAQVKETWSDDTGDTINIEIVPLVASIEGLRIPTQGGPFGVVLETDNSEDYILFHWSEAREFLKGFTTENDGIFAWLEGKEAPAKIAETLRSVSKSLNMLGFGTTDHPGAMEGHTMRMMDSYASLADAVSNGLGEIAAAIADSRSE